MLRNAAARGHDGGGGESGGESGGEERRMRIDENSNSEKDEKRMVSLFRSWPAASGRAAVVTVETAMMLKRPNTRARHCGNGVFHCVLILHRRQLRLRSASGPSPSRSGSAGHGMVIDTPPDSPEKIQGTPRKPRRSWHTAVRFSRSPSLFLSFTGPRITKTKG